MSLKAFQAILATLRGEPKGEVGKMAVPKPGA